MPPSDPDNDYTHVPYNALGTHATHSTHTHRDSKFVILHTQPPTHTFWICHATLSLTHWLWICRASQILPHMSSLLQPGPCWLFLSTENTLRPCLHCFEMRMFHPRVITHMSSAEIKNTVRTRHVKQPYTCSKDWFWQLYLVVKLKCLDFTLFLPHNSSGVLVALR